MAYKIMDKEGEAVKRDGKELFGADFLGVVKGVNLENRTLRILATDETRDRDGDIITMKGWRLENYIKNPVFLWAHDYSSVPIGAAIKIERKRTPSRIVLTHKFPTQGIHPFADMILQLYHERVINAGSVGFLPLEWEEIKEDEEKAVEEKFFFGPRKFTDQELLEHSGCAVPANPNALQDSIGNAMKSIKIGYDDKVKLYKVVTGEDILQLGDEEKERASSEIKEVIEKGAILEEETECQVQVPEQIDETEAIDFLTKEELTFEEIIDKYFEGEEFDDPFMGLKNLFDEILEELVADSLEDEKNVYRKRVEVLLKIGAVLNKKNKKLLRQASENILEVLKNAEPEDEAEEIAVSNQVTDESTNDEDKANIFDVILSSKSEKAEAPVAREVSKPKQKKKRVKIAQVNKVVDGAIKTLKTLKQ